MKVSISNTKPLFYDDNYNNFRDLNTIPFINNYEPTSVLELQRSPSPTTSIIPPQPSVIVDLDNSDGWDSILSELGFNEDSHQLTGFISSQPFNSNNNNTNNLLPDIQNFNPNFEPIDFPYDFIEDLFHAARAFETNDSKQADHLLSRLNQRLRLPSGKPLHRAAYYFKEALRNLTTGPTTRPDRLNSFEVVNTIRAHKSFAEISPVTLFSAFAANQAILEAVDGSVFGIHIVDFDIGFGGHWSSFMNELVDRIDNVSTVVRITAVVPDEFELESKLVRENLTQFALELNVQFYIDFVSFRSFELSSFESFVFVAGERLVVHLSSSVFHRLGDKFLGDLRGISPRIVVVVDKEVGIDTGTTSFSLSFIAGLEFYTAMIESLDVAGGGGGGDCAKRIEMYVIQPMINAAVEAAAERTTVEGRRLGWREAAVEAGMKAVGFSEFAEFQAEWLLTRAKIGGFHVANRNGEMMLCWHHKALVATSAWRC